ncbi:MAG: hypothetical protein ACYC6F_17560 [Longimicrobiales bacterium]
MAIEARQQVHDTVGLWVAWQEAVSHVRAVLDVEPNCGFLSGGRATILRSDYPGRAPVSVDAEVWRADDGQSYGAFLITRARIGGARIPDEAGMKRQKIECGNRQPL